MSTPLVWFAQRAVPARARSFEDTQAPTRWWRRKILGRSLAPSRSEYDRVCVGLWHGDPSMDCLVEWMFEVGAQRGRELFERVLNDGLESVPDAPRPLREFFESVERPPAWVDFEQVEEGVQFCHRLGDAAALVLRDAALMGGYLLTGFNRTLVMTGALNKGAARRFAETGKWWIDCTEPGGLRRFGPGFKSTLRVRLVHALVRRSLSRRPEWDDQEWGLPISQIDMVATYLGFCVAMLGGVRFLGIPVTAHESRAVMQLWSYAGWLMGVRDEWVCLREADGVVLLHHAMLTHGEPDWTSRELAKALADEPLQRSFPRFQSFRRWWMWHKHLSVSRYFLGATKMSQLGLPRHVSAWYPLLTLLPRFVAYAVQRPLPGFRERQACRGRRAQERMLASMFGSSPASIITPGRGHPAHV